MSESFIYLKHNQIDKIKWDDCIQSAPNSLVYAKSWYLDIVSPNWEAFVVGDYESVFPLTVKKINGIRFVAQPIFTQQLGWFGPIRPDFKIVLKHLKKRFLFGFLSINSLEDSEFEKRENLVLSLNQSYKELSANFSSNHRRNIKKVNSIGLRSKQITSEQFFEFFEKSNWNKKFELKDSHWIVMKTLVEHAIDQNSGKLKAVFNSNNEIVASAFLLKGQGRITYLFPITNQTGYKVGAQFFLIDDVIKELAGKNVVMDFEGSSIAGIRRFYLGFGAKTEGFTFCRFYKNRLIKVLFAKYL